MKNFRSIHFIAIVGLVILGSKSAYPNDTSDCGRAMTPVVAPEAVQWLEAAFTRIHERAQSVDYTRAEVVKDLMTTAPEAYKPILSYLEHTEAVLTEVSTPSEELQEWIKTYDLRRQKRAEAAFVKAKDVFDREIALPGAFDLLDEFHVAISMKIWINVRIQKIISMLKNNGKPSEAVIVSLRKTFEAILDRQLPDFIAQSKVLNSEKINALMSRITSEFSDLKRDFEVLLETIK